MNTFELEKWVWTENDFEKMGWHDATIYGIRLNQNLEIDLDYIFLWNQPEVVGFHFTFWVAPCTLVFESPKELSDHFHVDVFCEKEPTSEYLKYSFLPSYGTTKLV